jgi:hypothetical protein
MHPPTGPQGYDNLIYIYVVPHFSRMLKVFLGDDANFGPDYPRRTT